MAKFGYIVENALMAQNVKTLNRTAKSETNVDGGNLVTLGDLKNGCFVATLGTAVAKTGFWMAYNPSERFTELNGQLYAGLSADPRDYTNIKNRPFDIFKPQVGDIVTFTEANIEGAVNANTHLEPTANGKLAPKMSATASTTSFKILEKKTMPFPKAGIGMEYAKVYVCECVLN